MNEQLLTEAAAALRHAARLLEAAAGAGGVAEQAETPAPEPTARVVDLDRTIAALWRSDLLTIDEIVDRIGVAEGEVRARLVALGIEDPDLDRRKRVDDAPVRGWLERAGGAA